MSEIEKDIKSYIKMIGKKLICKNKQKKLILADIENSIYDFAENKGITNIQEIYDRFGTPEDVAKSYLFQEAPSAFKKKLSARKILITLLFCIMIIAFIEFLYPKINSYLVSRASTFKDTLIFVEESSSCLNN